MYKADIKGSIAFSKALLKAGILNEHEQSEITRGLKAVEAEWTNGEVRETMQLGTVLTFTGWNSSRYSRMMRIYILQMRGG